MANPTPADRSQSQPVPLIAVPDRERPRAHLPLPLTSFVGRVREIEAVADLVRRPGVRLVTLTGPGGVGKTRLAIRVATEIADEFPDGVWFVALAPIRDPSLVAATMAQTLGVQETATRTIEEGIREFLRERRALIVLDNFEHVLDAGPLDRQPPVDLSRPHRPGHKPGGAACLRRARRRRPAAPVVDGRCCGRRGTPTRLRGGPALRRAGGAARSDFVVTDQRLPTIAAICAKLDGLPLAIELAAARVASLSPAALLSLVERRLALLTGGPRDQPSRLRSMRDAIAWSYDLLSPEEQALFRRLSVFVGGFTLAAAEAVAGGGEDILDQVTSLVATSLVHQDEAG